jgi:hypothetical protein
MMHNVKLLKKLVKLQVLKFVLSTSLLQLAYGLDKRGTDQKMLFDLGGGTFDISVLELERSYSKYCHKGDTLRWR